MTKKHLLIASIISVIQSCNLTNHNELFTIYLVRHSEKELVPSDISDPKLTPCGKKRSESLSNFLKDIQLDAVYSTNYIRTRETALPTALSKDLEIKYYNGNELESFSDTLVNLKQNVLVVGHSNTTGVLAGLLTGKEIKPYDLNIYNRVYQVVIFKKKTYLNLLHSAFECID